MSNGNEQLIKFKEEILSKLKENELKMIDSHIILKTHVDRKITSLDKKCEEYDLRVCDLHEISINQKEKIEKINDLLKFKSDSENQLFSLDLRISNLDKDLLNACSKYDRHYLDNLVLPGTIGDYCRFKNLKEYLEVSVNYNI